MVIIVAVVISSGVLSMDSMIAEQCDFGNSAPCQFALFNNASTSSTNIILSVYNSYPYKIRIDDLKIATQDGSQSFTWLPAFPTPPNNEIDSGANLTLFGKLTGTMLPGSGIKRFNGNLTYESCAPELNSTGCSNSKHSVSGKIIGRIITG